MQSIAQYIKERFPLPSVLLFSFGYATLAIGISTTSNIWRLYPLGSIVSVSLLASVFFCFLLRQRAIDEFRDAEHDLKYFPDRPVPRGLVSKKQVLSLGLAALAVEIASAYIISQKAFGLYLLFFLYSLLMVNEFFISGWLHKHFTVYFLIHEVIFLLLGAFFIAALNPELLNNNLNTFYILAVLTAAPMGIEILRKFKPRYDTSGKAVADSYSTVWGRNNALHIIMSLSIIVGICLFLLTSSYLILIFSLIMITCWQLLGKKSDTAVLLIGVVNFLGFAVLINII